MLLHDFSQYLFLDRIAYIPGFVMEFGRYMAKAFGLLPDRDLSSTPVLTHEPGTSILHM
jgi:hypothetical protein